MAREVTLLPQPDSPTRPIVSPGSTSKLIPSTAWTGAPAAAGEGDVEVADGEQWHRHRRNLGSMASRNPSPSR